MESVAVVGLGAMGSRITQRLLDTGHQVLVWNRSPDKAAPLVARGAIAASTPREAASGSRLLITMLADPQALRSVSEGPDGIAAGAHPALLVIEMSTVGPEAVRTLASSLGPVARLVDAPVLGSVGEAESGALTIFAGAPGRLSTRSNRSSPRWAKSSASGRSAPAQRRSSSPTQRSWGRSLSSARHSRSPRRWSFRARRRPKCWHEPRSHNKRSDGWR